jgi:hypothetical protein
LLFPSANCAIAGVLAAASLTIGGLLGAGGRACREHGRDAGHGRDGWGSRGLKKLQSVGICVVAIRLQVATMSDGQAAAGDSEASGAA